MRREGFWYNIHEPELPMPVAGEHWEGQGVFLVLLGELEARAEAEVYRGMSTCRLCQRMNGSCTYQLGEWEWPEGLVHYVREHNVKPSPEFKTFVLGGGK